MTAYSDMENKSLLGVDLGGTNVRVGKVINSRIVNLFSQQISSQSNEQQVMAEVVTSIEECFDNSVAGIGVGVPSVVDVSRGIVYDVQNIPSWKKVHLKEVLEKKFNVPVYINNDANCFAAGEKYFGKGKDCKNFIGLIIGTGLGAGLYIENKLYSGVNCGAGEFGMLPYKDGCYEDYCSGQYFTNKLNIAGNELFEKAQEGDEEAIKIFQKFGLHVGDAIAAIMLAIDPELIVLGGSVSKAYKYFEETVHQSLRNFPYSNSIKNLKIMTSTLENVSVLGAAALYFEYHKEISSAKEI